MTILEKLKHCENRHFHNKVTSQANMLLIPTNWYPNSAHLSFIQLSMN